MKDKYYNQITTKKEMSIEEAETIIDDMYQDKYKIMEQKTDTGVTIDLSKMDEITFTNLEFASVIVLREIQSLRYKMEKQEKENTDLKELYIRTAKHQEKIGHTELAGYMLAQIEAVPTFTTWEEYTTWVDKDKIREFIKNELPDDEIMKCCSNYDVNGVRLRKELQKLLEEK